MDAITGKSEMILYKTEDGEVKLGELVEGATCKDYLQVQNEGKRQVSRARKFESHPLFFINNCGL